MAINNPYIPGDPYSYDLKWLVAKVKEILAQLGTLDEAIETKIFEGFLEHSVVQFKTVPEMLAANIKDGSIVLTLGYHEAGDQGGLFYLVKDFNPSQCALDYFLTLDNNRQIAIPVIVTPYVTPQMFGAKADNMTDCSDAFNKAIENGNITMIIPEGDYVLEAPVAVKSNTRIINQGIIYDKWAPTLTTKTGLFDAVNASDITITGMNILGTGAGGIGVFIPNKELFSFNNCDNIKVSDCNITETNADFAVRFNKCRNCIAEKNFIDGYSYSALASLNACHNVRFENNTVMNCKNFNVSNTYPIMLSGFEEPLSVGAEMPSDLYAINNYVYNKTPYWDCIDAHGGDNIVITGNICNNAFFGINAITDAARHFYASNVTISNNIVYCAETVTARDVAAYGISVGGDNITVSNNIIKNAGKGSNSSSGMGGGGIYASRCTNARIFGNNILNTFGTGMVISGTRTDNLFIYDNTIDTVKTTVTNLNGNGISFTNDQYGDVQIKNNIFKNCQFKYWRVGVLINRDSNLPEHIIFIDNKYDDMNITVSDFQRHDLDLCIPDYSNALPIGSPKLGNKGDIIKHISPTTGQPLGWICTQSFDGTNSAVWVALPSL